MSPLTSLEITYISIMGVIALIGFGVCIRIILITRRLSKPTSQNENEL